MDKRYQIFISSTYTDLKEERQKIFQTLMQMDCIPVGMELFPAIDDEQFEFIKRIIDDSDYYLLVIGGRYGTLNSEGISYTEKEYDYAISKGLKVISLLHENPEAIPSGKSEATPELKEKLEKFRNKVSNTRLIGKWSSMDQLPGLVALSLPKTIKTYPAIGWVRANQISAAQSLSELNEIRKENAELKKSLGEMQNHQVENLAGLDEKFEVDLRYEYEDRDGIGFRQKYRQRIPLTWEEIILLIAPKIFKENKSEVSAISNYIAVAICEKNSITYYNFPNIGETCFATITVQLEQLGIISLSSIPSHSFWNITAKGKKIITDLLAVKTKIRTTELA